MTRRMLQFVVIFLALLIILCFGGLIYGMYLKISKNQNLVEKSDNYYSLNLKTDEKIINIEALGNDDVLIKISDTNNTYAIIYDVKKNKIKSKIIR